MTVTVRGRLTALLDRALPVVAAARFVGVSAFRAAPGRSLMLLLMAVVSTFAFSFGALWMKLLIDAAVVEDWRAFAGSAVALGVVSYAGVSARMYQLPVQFRVVEATSMHVDVELMRMVTGLPGIEHHERPDLLDKLQLLRGEKELIGGSVHALVQITQVTVMLLTTAGLLATIDPRLLVLVPAGLPLLLVSPRAQRRMNRILKANAESIRLRDALFALTTSPEAAKEFRVFGLRRHLGDEHERIASSVERTWLRGTTINIVLNGVAQLLFTCVALGCVAVVVLDAVAGGASPGDVALAAMAAGQIQGIMAGTGGMLGWFTHCVQAIGRFSWLRGYSRSHARRAAGTTPAPARLREGIRFDGVRFRYPGTDVDVLHDVDLRLPAGATVAVVGDNGAGKSTLVKLLTRLYDPTEGRIEVDGVDLRDLDLAGWRQRMSGAFQDVLQVEFTARDTVGIGQVTQLEDEDAVLAACDRAAARDVVEQLPDGLRTQLGREFDDGTDLSGGQWQKLGLARAMMRPDPLLLVLDEPTAALDAGTEHALFERYAGAARTAGAVSGAITVLVSHRFSTVRMADLIVVVDGGTVTEVGSHDELMAARGTYAELFELQARVYR